MNSSDSEVDSSTAPTKSEGLDSICIQLLAVIVEQCPELAENPKLIDFLDASSQDRGDELAKITITVMNLANCAGNDGVKVVLDDMKKLQGYTDLMCRAKNLPFKTGMLDKDAWIQVQAILQVWVEYVKLEYKEIIKPMTKQQVVELARDFGTVVDFKKDKEKQEEEEEGYHSDGDYSSSASEEEFSIHSL